MYIENPIARYEGIALQHQFTRRGAGYWLRLVSYGFILFVAFIPLFIPIGDQQTFLLIFMMIILIPAQVLLVLRTLTLATEITFSQRLTGTWDTLALTGMSARKIVAGKRAAVIQSVWAEWMILAIARFGLAYGFTVYFKRGDYFSCLRYFPDAFCYESYGGAYSSIIAIVFAWISTILITHLHLLLVSLLGIIASLLPTKNRMFTWLVAGLLWFTVAGSGFGGLVIADRARQLFQCYEDSLCIRFLDYLEREIDNFEYSNQRYGYHELITDLRRLTDIGAVSVSTVGDSGVLLAAFIMRPTYAPNLTMLMRGMFCFIGALMAYRLLIWLAFSIAQRLAVAQGALPEPRRRSEFLHFLKGQIGFA